MTASSTGVVIFAQGDTYEKCANVLTKSLKKSNPTLPVYIASDFENDLAKDSDWKIENRSLVYDITPFENTYVMDADVLVLDKLPEIIKDLAFVSSPTNHKGEIITKDYKHRKVFIENYLPNIYTGFYYFQKNDCNQKFFDLVKDITLNFRAYSEKFLKPQPKHLSMDVIFALAIKLTNMQYYNVSSDINFVHAKFFRENYKLDLYDNIFVDLHKQSGIYHYVQKDLTDRLGEWVDGIYTS